MKNKCIVILRGNSEGKNKFQEIVKKRYWIWNISPSNLGGEVARLLGWDGNRDTQFNIFIDKLLDLGDNYFDFRYWYISNYKNKLLESDKAEKNNMTGDLMVIHGADDFLSKRLQDDYNIFEFTLNKTKQNDSGINGFMFCYNDEDFEEQIFKRIEELSFIENKIETQGENIDVTV